MVNPHHITRVGDPDTSFAAASSLDRAKLGLLRLTILHLLEETGRPLTDQDIVAALKVGWSESGIRTRRSELVRDGLVRDSGERAVLPSGRKAILWEVA